MLLADDSSNISNLFQILFAIFQTRIKELVGYCLMFWSFFRSRAQGEIKRGGGGAEEDRGVRVVLGPPVVKKVRDQKWSGRLAASGEVPGRSRLFRAVQ